MTSASEQLTNLARQATGKKLKIGVAESCTGGLLAAALTELPGSSCWFDVGVVSYSNAAKQRLLAVPAETLEQHGAVSLAVAEAMAEGLLHNNGVDLTVSITGIAGPGGGSDSKPVGTVCMAVAGQGLSVVSKLYKFDGDRSKVRQLSVLQAVNLLCDAVECF